MTTLPPHVAIEREEDAAMVAMGLLCMGPLVAGVQYQKFWEWIDAIIEDYPDKRDLKVTLSLLWRSLFEEFDEDAPHEEIQKKIAFLQQRAAGMFKVVAAIGQEYEDAKAKDKQQEKPDAPASPPERPN